MLKLNTAPASLPVSLADAKEHARIEDAASDNTVTALINAAVARLDGARGLLGRALITQTWDLILSGFPSVITVPLPPLQGVGSITYLDGDGASQPLAASVYVVEGIGGSDQATVRTAEGQAWPVTLDHPEAVTITFTAGYGDAAAVPPNIITAIKMHVAHLYANRESTTWAGNPDVLPLGYEDLIIDQKVWGFGC